MYKDEFQYSMEKTYFTKLLMFRIIWIKCFNQNDTVFFRVNCMELT